MGQPEVPKEAGMGEPEVAQRMPGPDECPVDKARSAQKKRGTLPIATPGRNKVL